MKYLLTTAPLSQGQSDGTGGTYETLEQAEFARKQLENMTQTRWDIWLIEFHCCETAND